MAIGCSNDKIVKLTPLLKSYETNVYNKVSNFESKKADVHSAIGYALTSYNKSYDEISSSGSDEQINVAKNSLKLVMEATERLKASMENDVGGVINKCKEVDNVLNDINKIYTTSGIDNWQPGVWERIVNTVTKVVTGHYHSNDQGKIDRANDNLRRLMKLAEDQIKAIKTSSEAVNLGILGNMKFGGQLGAYTNFDKGYSFSRETWEKANSQNNLNFLQQVGCFAVGHVEGVLKFGEGILDAAAGLVGGVCSAVGLKGAADSIKSFVAKDLSNSAASLAISASSGLTGISVDAYNNSFGRKAGKFVGTAQAIAAVTVATAGTGTAAAVGMSTGAKVITAMSMSGTTSEGMFASGKSYGESLTVGAGVGVLSYFSMGLGNKVFNSKPMQTLAQKVSKVTSWNPIQAISPHARRVGRIITAPGRKIANVQARLIAKTASKVKCAYSKIGAPIINKLPKFGRNANAGANTNTASAAQTQSNINISNLQELNNYRGSLGSNLNYQQPANLNGAPTASNSIFNDPSIQPNSQGVFSPSGSAGTASGTGNAVPTVANSNPPTLSSNMNQSISQQNSAVLNLPSGSPPQGLPATTGNAGTSASANTAATTGSTGSPAANATQGTVSNSNGIFSESFIPTIGIAIQDNNKDFRDNYN